MPDLVARGRGAFVRGILLLLPLAVTWVILRWLFRAVTAMTGPGAERLLGRMGIAPDSPAFPALSGVIALALTVGVVLLVGVVGGHYAGRRAWAALERVLMRAPLVRWFYGPARQIMDAFAAPGSGAFREVVLVEYPRIGLWALGFVTGPLPGVAPVPDNSDWIAVFLPTTPNPTSGYTIILPRSEAIPTRMSVDEGLKLIVSGGFIAPSGSGREDAAAAPALPHRP
ncbi:MAG TPA: DUF502 domain-containing protein [Candidatus Polarisedimenticolia bacterium]|nr:DUF502 domain-containing protein [Candidatus Polarisedimenticolia bacterium]